MKFESLVSVDSSKDGTLQNFPPAKHILTQLDVATDFGSGRIADIFHCSHRSIPTVGLICRHQTCKITELSQCMRTKRTSDETSKHLWGGKGYLGYLHVLCTNLLDPHVVHPPPDSHEVLVLSFAAKKMLTNRAWTPHFQSVPAPAQVPFFSPPSFHVMKHDERCFSTRISTFLHVPNYIRLVGQVPGISWLSARMDPLAPASGDWSDRPGRSKQAEKLVELVEPGTGRNSPRKECELTKYEDI